MKDFTLEEKFAKVIVDLRKNRPFYSAVYEAMPRRKTEAIDTCGVSASEMIYNEQFMDKISYEEFLFIILHEIGHVMMMHVPRRMHREKTLWNVACDLFVNQVLCNEFSLKPGTSSRKYNIHAPENIVYSSTLDIENESVEEIYKSFDEQARTNGFYDTSISIVEFEYRGLLPGDSYKFKIVKMGGLSGTMEGGGANDLMDDGSDRTMQEDQNRKILVDAQTRHEMMSGGKDCGSEAGRFKFFVDKLLESKIDWKKILRKYLVTFKSKDITFSNPDKRMYYQSAIYPGVGAEVEERLRDVKICIDTSGSISDEDLQYFMGQVKQLLDQYSTNAELINWDTEVESSVELKDNTTIRNNKQYNMMGRGGTDPSCLFHYFDSKQCKVKPYVVLVFTDGYFDIEGVTDRQRKKYKNTIWVMTRDYNKSFKPEFGKLAFADFGDGERK